MDRAEEHPAGINTHHRPGRQIGTIPEPKLTVFLGAYEWGEAFRSGCCRQRGIWQGLLLSAGTRNSTSPHHPQMPCIGRCRLHAGMRWHARRWSARYNTLLKTIYLILSGDALPGAMSGDTVCRAHRNMPPAQLRRCGGRRRLQRPRDTASGAARWAARTVSTLLIVRYAGRGLFAAPQGRDKEKPTTAA